MTKPPTCWLKVARKADDLVDQLQGLGKPAVGRVEPELGQPLAAAGRRRPSPRSARRSPRPCRCDRPMTLPTSRIAALAAVMDHRGAEPGAVAAVAVVDVLDHLLAPLVLEIDVDVGRLVARLRDEALEDHGADLGRDRGDAERVADHRIGRRAAALAEDALRRGRSRRCRARSGNRGRSSARRSARSSWSTWARTRSGTPAG